MIIEVRLSSIGDIVEFTKKDGTKGCRRQVRVYVHDYSQPVTDYLALCVTGQLAQDIGAYDFAKVYRADVKLDAREWNGKMYQDCFLRSIAEMTPGQGAAANVEPEAKPF